MYLVDKIISVVKSINIVNDIQGPLFSMFDIILNKWFSIGIYFHGFIYGHKKYNDSEKFIVDISHKPKIEILELTYKLSYDEEIERNIEKIIYDKLTSIFISDENLKDINFITDVPIKIVEDISDIFVSFRLNNNTYFIVITDLNNLSKKSEIKKLPFAKRIISAELIDINMMKKDVTNLLISYQGPEYNFYNNLNGVSNKFSDILSEYDLSIYRTLIINDLFGLTHKYHLDKQDTIEWSSHF